MKKIIILMLVLVGFAFSQQMYSPLWWDANRSQYIVRPFEYLIIDSTTFTAPSLSNGQFALYYTYADPLPKFRDWNSNIYEIAMRDLSNITAIKSNLSPHTSSYTLGSAGNFWGKLFVSGGSTSNGVGFGSNGYISTLYTYPLSTNRSIALPNADGVLMINPMTSVGDIVYGGSSGIPQRLAVGSEKNVLTVSGGTLSWKPPFRWSVTGSPAVDDSIRFVAGTGVTLSRTGNALTINSSGGVDLTNVSSHIYPSEDNLYVIGSDYVRWKDIYTYSLYVNKTVHAKQGIWMEDTAHIAYYNSYDEEKTLIIKPKQKPLANDTIIIPMKSGTFVVSKNVGSTEGEIVRWTGTEWETKKIFYDASMTAANDSVQISIPGLNPSTAIVSVSWSNYANNNANQNPPLGTPYVKRLYSGGVTIASNADEQNPQKVLVTVIKW